MLQNYINYYLNRFIKYSTRYKLTSNSKPNYNPYHQVISYFVIDTLKTKDL